jgi:pimeloyl-ACP methyl ester carboxylesterase
MKKVLIAIALVAVLIAVAVGTGIVLTSSPVSDPASARCEAPAVAFGKPSVLADHREVEVHFTCVGDRQAGTLYLPKRTGRSPAVVYVHGSGEAPRWSWEVPWVQMTVGAGIAFFSYDKRGVGESEGTCCPGDTGHFNLLAADANGAVNALRKRSDIAPSKIGFLGTSEAGWVVPLAVARSEDRVGFMALASAPTVTTHEEQQWSRLAGEDEDNPPQLTKERRDEITAQLDPSGFDPAPLLKQSTVPGIWVYGSEDRSQPSEKSASILELLRKNMGKDFTAVLFPGAGHGLLDTPPTDPRAMPTLLAWMEKHTRAG